MYASARCKIQTRFVGEEDNYADHLTTTKAQNKKIFHFVAEEIPGSSRQQLGITTASSAEVIEAGAVGVASATSTSSASTGRSGSLSRTMLLLFLMRLSWKILDLH